MVNQKIQLDLLSVHNSFNIAYQFMKKYSEIENTKNFWQTVFEEYSKLSKDSDTLTVRLLNEAYAFLIKTGMEMLKEATE